MKLRIFTLGMAAALLTMASAAPAQQASRPGQIGQLPAGQMEQRPTSSMPDIARPGQVVNSAVGQVGQRQTAASILAEPMGRISNRIANRVQNRIRNRIDRAYDPTANTTSPFEVAAERVTSGQPAQ